MRAALRAASIVKSEPKIWRNRSRRRNLAPHTVCAHYPASVNYCAPVGPRCIPRARAQKETNDPDLRRARVIPETNRAKVVSSFCLVHIAHLSRFRTMEAPEREFCAMTNLTASAVPN